MFVKKMKETCVRAGLVIVDMRAQSKDYLSFQEIIKESGEPPSRELQKCCGT